MPIVLVSLACRLQVSPPLCCVSRFTFVGLRNVGDQLLVPKPPVPSCTVRLFSTYIFRNALLSTRSLLVILVNLDKIFINIKKGGNIVNQKKRVIRKFLMGSTYSKLKLQLNFNFYYWPELYKGLKVFLFFLFIYAVRRLRIICTRIQAHKRIQFNNIRVIKNNTALLG